METRGHDPVVPQEAPKEALNKGIIWLGDRIISCHLSGSRRVLTAQEEPNSDRFQAEMGPNCTSNLMMHVRTSRSVAQKSRKPRLHSCTMRIASYSEIEHKILLPTIVPMYNNVTVDEYVNKWQVSLYSQ